MNQAVLGLFDKKVQQVLYNVCKFCDCAQMKEIICFNLAQQYDYSLMETLLRRGPIF